MVVSDSYTSSLFLILKLLPINSDFNSDKMQTSKRNNRRVTVVQRNIRGGTFRPATTPQVFSLTPFNQVILRLRENAKSPWNITIGDLHATMTKQLGFTDTKFSGESGFEIKIISIAVWNVVEANSDLTLVARDPSGTTSSELARVDSMGMKNMYARAGYNYPVNVSSCVYHTLKDASKQVASCYATRPGYEVHLRIQWRGAYFSVSSTLSYEDFSPNPLCVGETCPDDIDAEIDAMECKLRILELRKIKANSSNHSVCG